jgi:hypothetical protein
MSSPIFLLLFFGGNPEHSYSTIMALSWLLVDWWWPLAFERRDTTGSPLLAHRYSCMVSSKVSSFFRKVGFVGQPPTLSTTQKDACRSDPPLYGC